MRLWILSYQEKCPAGTIEAEQLRLFLNTLGVINVHQLSRNTLYFQSRDDQNWRYWRTVSKEVLEPYFYYSILELKNSDCRPVGAIKRKEDDLLPAISR